jgi:hypothetical protein
MLFIFLINDVVTVLDAGITNHCTFTIRTDVVFLIGFVPI